MKKHWVLFVKRNERGLSQREVAKAIGISMNNYALKENCKLDFTLRECQALAEFFDTTLTELFPIENSKEAVS